jgi:hypothetical protein
MKKRFVSSSCLRSSRAVPAAALASALCGVTALSVIPARAADKKNSGMMNGNAKMSKKMKNAKSAGIEPWAGRRVLFMMPLQLGEGWNADVNFGRAILPRAEELLQNQLQKTGKFSVVRAHRFSPLIQRGLQEKRLTEDQVIGAIGDDKTGALPTLEGVSNVLGQFVFDRPAMIADFRLQEVRSGGDAMHPSVQVQVTGHLYEMTPGPTPTYAEVTIKSPITFTSAPARDGRNNIDRFLMASDNAFMQIADGFVAPIQDIQFSMPGAKSMGTGMMNGMTNNGTASIGAGTKNTGPAAPPAIGDLNPVEPTVPATEVPATPATEVPATEVPANPAGAAAPNAPVATPPDAAVTPDTNVPAPTTPAATE